MEPYERAYLEAVMGNFAASMANCMHDGVVDAEIVESRHHLTDPGRLWVCGYMTSRLSALRAGCVGNPNLTADDLDAVTELVTRRESEIAAELYA